ncbi:intracellular serine protease [Cladorrhinum sp. PSN332]|nr:intracellular serine protease [Cladorrhinum sp. PSN332]
MGPAGAADSSSDDSDDDDDNGKTKPESNKASVAKLLLRNLQEIAGDKKDLTKKADLETFMSNEIHGLAGDTGDKDLPTALHMLLSNTMAQSLPEIVDSQKRVLVTALVQHSSDPMAKGDRDGKTPLYQALDLKKEDMVKWMCEAHPNINSILCKSSNNQHYLHLAVKKKLKYLAQLIGKADGRTLALQDAEGNTVLHLLVVYKRCRKGQLPIIRDVVARSNEAIENLSFTPDFNLAGQSPYLRHKTTVNRALRRAKEGGKSSREGNDVVAKITPPNDKGTARSQILNDQDISQRSQHKISDFGSSLRYQSSFAQPGMTHQLNLRDMYTGVRRTSTLVTSAGNGDNPHLKAASGSNPETWGIGTVGYKKPTEMATTAVASTAVKESKAQVDVEVIQCVEKFLKLHYLRSRSYRACMEILYGRDKLPEVELYFDLTGRSSMSSDGFKGLLSHLEFEDALQYVAIPAIKIEGAKEGRNRKQIMRDRPCADASGRQDLVQVFSGLRTKGVTTILKVVVDDSISPPHTDEAIEDSLRNLGIEVWDWKKMDICSEVIYKAAPQVREVHLYWGGNNAVLRGWSEEGGLKRLSELQKIYLHVQRGIESTDRTEQYVNEFEARIGKLSFKNTPKLIKVKGMGFKPDSSGLSRAQVGSDEKPEASKHNWIDCMKQFRGLLVNLERSAEYQRLEEPIKVALIDDGVDFMDVESPQVGGQTFCPRDEENNLNHPYYASATGHGTIMAKLINFICPRAELYVLRLEDHPSTSEGARQIGAESAAKAIAAAVRKGVHVISMSWTIEIPTDERVKAELDKAISDADKANILMFCSASDQGAKNVDTYPSKGTRRIFTIGAAGASGETISFVGDLRKIDFTFPGDRVEILDGNTASSGGGSAREVSGSSAATALAAGFAALLLYCVQVRLLRVPREDTMTKAKVRMAFEALRSYDQMKTTFMKTIGTSQESKFKFITVWELFGNLAAHRDLADYQRVLDLVSDIGERICSGIFVNYREGSI